MLTITCVAFTSPKTRQQTGIRIHVIRDRSALGKFITVIILLRASAQTEMQRVDSSLQGQLSSTTPSGPILGSMLKIISILLLIFGFVPLSLVFQPDEPRQPNAPEYTTESMLKFPEHYREWVFLSSGVGMTYGPMANMNQPSSPTFDNVFVNPESYRAFLETGHWPDKTVFVLEVRSSESHGSINQGGHFPARPHRH